MAAHIRPRIGMLWGDVTRTAAPARLGKLWSMGRVARDIFRALQSCGQVIPYHHSPETVPSFSFDEPSSAQREELASFLRGIDILWADLYPASEPALTLRDELGLSCSAILFAGGVLPKGAEAMLFPWQQLLRPDDGILFSSSADRTIWRRLVDRSQLHEWVVPLSADEQIFHPRDSEEQMKTRARYQLPAQTPLLLYVGRLNIQKNLHTLLRFFATVREQVPDALLCLVGEEDNIGLHEFGVLNTGYVAWLRQLAAELGIDEQVRFLGPLFGAELAQMYAAADVVVNFSLYHRENFGLSQAEAATSGVPVLCTAWGGFKDVVQEGITGYTIDAMLTKNGVRVHWRQGVQPVVALLQQRELREKLGRQAATYAREHFSIAALEHRLAQIIDDTWHTDRAVAAQPAYQPSEFAVRYEAHKHACGWYAPANEVATWYPRMFQSEAYALYETLMQPYATQIVQETDVIQPGWVPYFPSPVTLDPLRRLMVSEDPVWPHRRFLSAAAWEIVQGIDGECTAQEIAQIAGINYAECTEVLRELYMEGFVLFSAI
ncbi:MAG: glycosyltransferase family 4 protein [Ktedonobacteraceae bacterium]|nr:glycosyltransferase family 4 protein [Ktedonobacteraceae bacterium]